MYCRCVSVFFVFRPREWPFSSAAAGILVAEDAEDASLYDFILSRYCEGDPEDDNDLYEALHALRKAHMPHEDAKDVSINVRRGLFSPVDGGEDEEEEDPAGHERGWTSLFWQGFGTVLDFVVSL